MRAAVALGVLALLLAGCTSAPPASNSTTPPASPPGGSSPPATPPSPSPPGATADCAALVRDADGTNPAHTKVEVQTNHGTFKVELFDDVAPRTAANFKTYVEGGFFDHVVYHRILKDFMMQGGKFDNSTKQAKQPTQGAVVNEAASSGCRNAAYTLSMARTNDPNSARSEFFVNFKDNTFLDPSPGNAGYAVFGVVYEGRDVVDRIENVPVHVYNSRNDPMCQPEQGNAPNCPDQPVEMVRLRVV